MEEIKIKIIFNGEKVSKIDLSTGKIFLESGEKLDKKKLKTCEITCDDCGKISEWSSVPEKKYLLKENFLCRTCRQIGEKNNQFGKKWDDNRRHKKGQEMIGENNPMYNRSIFDVWVQKHGFDNANILLENHRQKSKKVGIENGMYGKKFYDIWVEKYGTDMADEKLTFYREGKKLWLLNNKDHHNKMIINSHLGKYKKTSIEKKVELYLKESGINYKYNFIMDNLYQFDFLLKDKQIIIETHGDYWHANPKIYSDEDSNKKKLNDNQKYKVKLDKLKFEYASKKYQIIYLWETDIKNEYFKEILNENGIN